MDIYCATEAAYKNGFEAGYVKGMCEGFAKNVLRGAIEWHQDGPVEDVPYCYICVKAGDRKYVIRPAAYKHNGRTYITDDYTDDGRYYQKRLERREVIWWAKMRDPFTARYSFRVPEDAK